MLVTCLDGTTRRLGVPENDSQYSRPEFGDRGRFVDRRYRVPGGEALLRLSGRLASTHPARLHQKLANEMLYPRGPKGK